MRTNWRTFGEITAALAVVVSLIFVGLEIDQSTRATSAEARANLSTQSLSWLELIASDEELYDIWRRRWQLSEPDENFTESEIGRSLWLMNLNMRRLENVYIQFLQGVVDESVFDSYGFPEDSATYSSDRFKSSWGAAKNRFNPEFVEFFDARVGITN